MTDARIDAYIAAFRARLETWIAPLSFKDKQIVLDWVEQALEGLDDPSDEDNLDAGLLHSLIDGSMEIVGVKDGSPAFRLTQHGNDVALQALVDDPEMRAFHNRLTARLGRGQPISDPPKDKQ